MSYVGTTQLFQRRYEIYGIAMEICELVTRDLSNTSSLKSSTVCTNTIHLPQSAKIWSKQKKTRGISKTVKVQSRDDLAATLSHGALVCVCQKQGANLTTHSVEFKMSAWHINCERKLIIGHSVLFWCQWIGLTNATALRLAVRVLVFRWYQMASANNAYESNGGIQHATPAWCHF